MCVERAGAPPRVGCAISGFGPKAGESRGGIGGVADYERTG